MNQAFFVVGPESSGTKLITKLLIEAGCFGDPGDEQRMDRGFPKDGGPENIVYRQSFPCRKVWPDLLKLINDVRQNNYKSFIIVMTRDWKAMELSQAMRGHILSGQELYENVQASYVNIFRTVGVLMTEYLMISYESLYQRPEQYGKWIFKKLSLDSKNVNWKQVTDQNAKHYES